MKQVELHLECYVDERENNLADLGIDIEESTEWRVCTIPVDAIMMCYPRSNYEDGTVILIGGGNYHVKEIYDVVRNLIQKSDTS